MGGGLMQLVAYGAQDIYLTGNPQITFFKVVYRRHTNFAMECIEQTINGTAAASGSVTSTVSRNGDLVNRMYVSSTEASIVNGSAMVASAELEIGGQKIDKHTAEWMNIWTELSTPESKSIGLKAMQGDTGTCGSNALDGVGMVQVPLQFWFCRNPGLALPLIALQYHEVKVKLVFGSGVGAGSSTKLWADYIYLDTDERRRFAQVSHEYLIEQVQEVAYTSSTTVKLNFNHPVKELVWTTPVANVYVKANLKLNGHDRFAMQEEEYFQLRQPFDHHTALPRQNLPGAAQSTLLDRAATLTALTNGTVNGAYTRHATDGGNADGDFTWDDSLNTLALRGAGAMAASAALLTVGTQIVLVAGDASAVANTQVYTAVVTVAGVANPTAASYALIVTTNANALALVITDPVSTKGTGTFFGGGDSNAGDTLSIYIVDAGQSSSAARTSQMTSKINVYSFALKPEEHQPSGTCNFSRIDNAQLNFSTAPGAGNIYAVNYNVLRIMSGMGGLAYSN